MKFLFQINKTEKLPEYSYYRFNDYNEKFCSIVLTIDNLRKSLKKIG
jgi:hypothetical protein